MNHFQLKYVKNQARKIHFYFFTKTASTDEYRLIIYAKESCFG